MFKAKMCESGISLKRVVIFVMHWICLSSYLFLIYFSVYELKTKENVEMRKRKNET